MRRRILTGARLHVAQLARYRPAMLTLTYRGGVAWEARHVSDLLRHLRQWCARRGAAFRYTWVAEIQEQRKRNEPDFHCVHYHILLWLPPALSLPKPDKQGWWPHGLTKIERVRHAVGYIAKYVSKGDDHAPLPKGARMYGVGGLEGEALAEWRHWALPKWLRDQVEPSARVRRRRGGGWLDRDTGECYASPWRVLFRGGGVWIVRDDRSGPITLPAAGEA